MVCAVIKSIHYKKHTCLFVPIILAKLTFNLSPPPPTPKMISISLSPSAVD